MQETLAKQYKSKRCRRPKNQSSENKLKRARWYIVRNRTYKAARIFFDLLKTDPDNTEALLSLSQIYQDRGDFELAFLCYRELRRIQPNNQTWRLKSINLLFFMQDLYQVKLEFAIHKDWNKECKEEALFGMSQCEYALGNLLEAVTLLNKLIEEYPNPLYFMAQAEMFENLGLYHLAMESTKRGLKRDPYFDALLNSRARLHLYLGEYKSAKEIYLKMIKNQMFMEEARADIEDFQDDMGIVPEVNQILIFFDSFENQE